MAADQNDVLFGVLELASECETGLVEFHAQWPRELIRDALVDLNRRGLVAIVRFLDLSAGNMPVLAADAVLDALADEATWNPSPTAWRTGTYMAIVATPAGDREYERLVCERPTQG